MENQKFVSRAGDKLSAALEKFKIDVKDLICADLGSSTGGFVDCLLSMGAKKVYSVDTAYGQLDWKLRNDKRVVVMERTNALNVLLPEKVDFISIDVGWTKQELIIPQALTLLKDQGKIVSLLKPHYEIEKKLLKKGKVPEEMALQTANSVKDKLISMGINVVDIMESPIRGEKGGNIEYLLSIKK